MSEVKQLSAAVLNDENKASNKQSNAVQNPRLITKKRTHYNSVSHTGANGVTLATGGVAHTSSILGNRAPYGKNSRKSRNGYRHEPKKGL